MSFTKDNQIIIVQRDSKIDLTDAIFHKRGMFVASQIIGNVEEYERANMFSRFYINKLMLKCIYSAGTEAELEERMKRCE